MPLPLLVEEILLDYEYAVRNALRKVFPGVKLRGCKFHWCQCVQERFKLEGLTDGQTTKVEKRICRLLLALPLLQHEKIERAFINLYDQSNGRERQVCAYMDY